MLPDMMCATLRIRLICLGVIATLFCAVVQPAWAEDEEQPEQSAAPEEGGDFKDPTIVTDDSTSTPDGVKDLNKKPEKKPIENPVYEKWWFWATVVGVAGAWAALSVYPMQKKAPGCSAGARPLGCIGDGR
jgi:hypothetical protein